MATVHTVNKETEGLKNSNFQTRLYSILVSGKYYKLETEQYLKSCEILTDILQKQLKKWNNK